jgi:hypothetical protein
MELDAAAPALRLPLERPLYTPVQKVRISSDGVRDACEETDPAALFEQFHVDPVPLAAGVRAALRRQPSVGLQELVEQRPIELGLAELVTYLSLTDDGFQVIYDQDRPEEIGWSDGEGTRWVATLARVSYARIQQ